MKIQILFTIFIVIIYCQNDDVCSELCRAKRAGRPIRFAHIHKSGGTTACTLARLNNERTPLPAGRNCNAPGGTFNLQLGASSSCEELIEYVRRTGDTFLASERYLPDVDSSEDFSCNGFFFTAVIVRRPLDRIRSHLKMYHNVLEVGMIATLLNASSTPFPRQHHSHQPLYSHEFFNDYVIRFILGPKLWASPLSFINKTHAALAFDVLRDFDFVASLEHNGLDRLVACVGWNTSHQVPHKNPARISSPQLDKHLQSTLETHSALDNEMWRWIAHKTKSCRQPI